MLPVGLAGCGLLLMGPPLLLLAAAYDAYPQLIVVFCPSVLVAFLPYAVVGAMQTAYMAVRGCAANHHVADDQSLHTFAVDFALGNAPTISAEALAVPLVVVFVLLSCAVRVAMCYLVCVLENWLQKRYVGSATGVSQKSRRHTLLAGRWRLMPVFASVGAAVGLTSAVAGPLAMLDATGRLRYESLVLHHVDHDVFGIDGNDTVWPWDGSGATWGRSGTGNVVVSYDLDACPALPRLLHLSLQSLLLWLSHVVWAVVIGRACVDLFVERRQSRDDGLHDHALLAQPSASGSDDAGDDAVAPLTDAPATSVGVDELYGNLSSETHVRRADEEMNAPQDGGVPQSRPAAADGQHAAAPTGLLPRAVAQIAGVCALQLVSSAASLWNRGAMSALPHGGGAVAYEGRWRGCHITLPAQAAVLCVSVIVAALAWRRAGATARATAAPASHPAPDLTYSPDLPIASVTAGGGGG